METNGQPAETTNPAEELFDTFLYSDNNVLTTLEQFRELKSLLGLNDVPHYQLFSKLKGHFTSWKLTSFMEILQRRLNVKEYVSSVEKCKDCNIFIIGAGPCGLRCAIEAALCGAYVVVAEKRTSFTRNNVLHLWPYLIHDLRNLGIKKLFGKFCAGSLDHISIRRLQLILMKIALVLGVKVFVNTSFVEYLEPCNTTGWRISVKPSNTEIEMTDFDVLVGADGKRNSIPGFQRKEFRAKLAIGITANFVNKNSDEEAKIEEISGVAALFNQKFFADLKTETSIDLENIVYYKDDTHYFVMTAKKQCLLKKGVLKEDHNDVIKLLAYQNVDNSQLLNFVSEAADFSTGLPHSEFATNPDNGKPDVAIFDFTSMYSAEYAAKILERRDKRLIIGLVGDGLMEPFWPLGTGCARGFLSCMDLMWMIKQHQSGMEPIELLEERMALFQILHQTSNENMNKKHSAYTMNPKTRYKLIPKFTEDVSYLYENDEKENKRARTERYSPEKTSPNKRLAGETTETVHKQWKKSTFARTRKPKNPSNESGVLQKKRSASPTGASDQETLRQWCSDRLKLILPFLPVTDLDSCWRDGVLLCGLVHLCAPSEIDMSVVKSNTDSQNVDLAITVMFNEFGIQTLTAQDVLPPSGPDLLAIMSTILELQKCYQDLEKGVKRAKPLRPVAPAATVDSALIDGKSAKKKKLTSNENEKSPSKPTSVEKPTTPQKTSAQPEAPAPMDVDMPSPGALKKRVHSQRKVRKKTEAKFIAQVDNVEALAPNTPKKQTPVKGSQKCHTCALSVLVLKRITVEGYVFHRKCFVCEECGTSLKTSTYHLITSPDPSKPGRFFCKTHFTEIMSRSRELKKTTEKKPQTRNKEKKTPRPVSGKWKPLPVNTYSEDLDPVLDISVKITRLKSPLNIHFRVYLYFYNDDDEEIAHVWLAYNMVKEDDPTAVDAPIMIHNTGLPWPQDSEEDGIIPECDSRTPSIKTENVVADHVIFKVVREDLIFVDKTVIDLSHFSCYTEIGWKDLVSVGSVSKMKLYVKEMTNGGFGEPTSDYLTFSYKHILAHYDSVKISNRTFRPSTPVVPEDEVTTDITPTKPDLKPDKPSRNEPTSTPARPAPPTSTTPAPVPSPDSRYRDTALEIHKDKTSNKRGPESPAVNKRRPESPAVNKRTESAKTKQLSVEESVTSRNRPISPQSKPVPDPKSPKLAGRIKITETKSPELARTRTASARLGKEAGAKKVASFHEDLPTEGIPDSTRKDSGPRGASSVPVDHLPSEGLPPQPLPPNSNITVRKKSKKAHKAPAPPKTKEKTKDKSDRSGSEHSLHSGSSESRDRSKSEGGKKFAYKKKSEHSRDFVADEGWTQPMISRSTAKMTPSPDIVEKTSDKPATDIASGVKGRVIKDAAVKKPANTKPPQKPKPETRHTRASSVSQVETYIPEFSKHLQDNISNKVDEGGPVSVKDRIALCAQRDLQTSSSFSAGPRKRVEVSSDLKRSVTRDGSRIAASRGTVESDSSSTPNKFTRAQNIRRKRLRLKPTNKANQRRLAQAQQIQRDRSLLEQKMTEFENTAAEIEMLLRDSGNDDKHLLSQFLELVNMKNEMTRRENELHLCEKYLQLMDEQDQIERDLRYLLEMKDSEKEEQDHLEEEELILKKFDVVNRRDYLLTQLDDNKRREEEENKQINDMLASKGMSSKQYSYNTESFLTIESLLEPDGYLKSNKPDDEKPDDDVEDTLEMFEQSTAQVQRRQKKGRKDGDENAISRFFNRMSIFN